MKAAQCQKCGAWLAYEFPLSSGKYQPLYALEVRQQASAQLVQHECEPDQHDNEVPHDNPHRPRHHRSADEAY